MKKYILLFTILMGVGLFVDVVQAQDTSTIHVCTCIRPNPPSGEDDTISLGEVQSETECTGAAHADPDTGDRLDCNWIAQPDTTVSTTTSSGGSSGAARGATISLKNPIGIGTDIPTLIGTVIKAALGIMGSLALAAFLYGGFIWLVSSGNPERVKKGWNTIIYATIGIFVVLASYGILITIISGLQ